jgi:hypothetical protein
VSVTRRFLMADMTVPLVDLQEFSEQLATRAEAGIGR